MREKSACAALNRTPSANGGAVPASDHLSIARRSAQADDHATKTLLFEVPLSEMTRIVRPEGTVGLYVWDYAGQMQIMRYFFDSARLKGSRNVNGGRLRIVSTRTRGLEGDRARPADVRFGSFATEPFSASVGQCPLLLQ